MALRAGLFGGGWEDYHDKYVKPVLDDLDRQISDIRINGVEGQLARMQAQDDALEAAAGGVSGQAYRDTSMLPIGSNRQDGSWYNFPGAANIDSNTSSPGSSASAPTDISNKSKLFGGIADAFGGAGLGADLASGGATLVGRAGGGDTAVLRGLEGTTRRIISTPLAVAEGVSNTFKDVAAGYTPAESILGNILRSGAVYGGGTLAGMSSGVAGPVVGPFVSYELGERLPSGGAIGHFLLQSPASKYDFPTTVMLRAK